MFAVNSGFEGRFVVDSQQVGDCERALKYLAPSVIRGAVALKRLHYLACKVQFVMPTPLKMTRPNCGGPLLNIGFVPNKEARLAPGCEVELVPRQPQILSS